MQQTLMAAISRMGRQIGEYFPFLVPSHRGSIHYYVFVAVLMFFALLARLAIAPVNAGLQYLTFFPSVAISAVVGGLRPGMFAVAIGLTMATFIFIPPYWTVSLEVVEKSMWSNMVFMIDGLIICISIEAMHRYREQFQKESKEARESEERIRAVNKELDDFTYIASHDLKEPLRGIHNYASFLKEDYADKLDTEAQQYINSIQRLAERMTTLTDQLLHYSRLGSKSMKVEPASLNAIADDVIEDLSALREDGVEIRRVSELGNALCDPLRIGEVFQNLITNGAKYNNKPHKWVEIGCDRSAGVPVYFVRDNGIGIQQQHKDSVFRIFKRLHEQNKYGGGTGAGLTIVKKIIERHGGHIWLESEPGEGTTFYFTLNGEPGNAG